MSAHDAWYFEVSTRIAGESRGFSRQILAREDRSRTIPTPVENVCQSFLSDVLDGSDVHAYSSVLNGARLDWPYRTARYVLTCNGREIVRSWATRPVKPEVMVNA
jgi:hypothetical protein